MSETTCCLLPVKIMQDQLRYGPRNHNASSQETRGRRPTALEPSSLRVLDSLRSTEGRKG